MQKLNHIIFYLTTLLFALNLGAQNPNLNTHLNTHPLHPTPPHQSPTTQSPTTVSKTPNIEQEKRFALAFYNVENLFDTIPSTFYDDTDFTPDGKYRWNTPKYKTKLKNIAQVIDQLNADIVGLAEVENELVIRDLVTTITQDYCYIHRTTSDRRGMDMALLYKGDRFVPEKINQIKTTSTREILHVKGKFWGEPIDILVWHAPSKFNSYKYRKNALKSLRAVIDSLRKDPEVNIVVMGDMNADVEEKVFRKTMGKCKLGRISNAGLYAPITKSKGHGGSYIYDGWWSLPDNIFVDERIQNRCQNLKGGIFIQNYLLISEKDINNYYRKGYPLRTFVSNLYLAGYSDHLPVFVEWKE